MIKSGKDLTVFKRAYALSLALHQESLVFPKIEQFSLASQLRRSSKLICANLVEGFAKQNQSKVEFKRFITIAIGSAQETDLWIQYAFDLKYINVMQFEYWTKENSAVISMLITLRSKL